MFGFSRPQFIVFLLMLALIVVCPYVLYPVFLMRVLCIALFACAFNLMIGYVGLLSFGHAAFFGMGSYVAAWTMKFWHVDAVVAILLGGITAAALGLCLGYLAIRRSGIYFAMITLALAQLVYFFCVEAPFTGGEDGIQQVPRGYLFGCRASRPFPLQLSATPPARKKNPNPVLLAANPPSPAVIARSSAAMSRPDRGFADRSVRRAGGW